MLGPLEWYMTPTIDAALFSRSKAGADLGRTSDINSKAFPITILTANTLGHES